MVKQEQHLKNLKFYPWDNQEQKCEAIDFKGY